MPKGTKVARCVTNVTRKGGSKSRAIRICQSATGQSYQTGRKPKAR